MTSFLSRVAGEAAAALSDAYGHVVHGDDAGSSARVVWVVHPTRVPIDLGGGEGANKRDGGAEVVGSPGRDGKPLQSSYLFTQKFDLGLTFLEINDRAYVKTVDPGSSAERAGIQPQDCVQFACVVGGPRFEDLQIGSSASDGRRSSSSRRESKKEEEKRRLDARAAKFVLECEKKGMRTGYEELRDLFAGCTLPPKGDSENNNQSDMRTPPRAAALNKADDDFTIGSNSLMMTDSVGGMFERTNKPHEGNISSRRVPIPDSKIAKSVTLNVTNAARNAAGRCFEPSTADEDGEGSAHGEEFGYRSKNGRGSIPELDTPMSPIKSDNVVSTVSSSHRSRSTGASYGDSVVEQSLYPVVMVFRRTVQRKSIVGLGWGSPGLSLRGSLFGIPSFRMDDECDRAAALIRQLAPGGSGSHRSSGKDNREGGESSNEDKNGDENIEASTIRGMLNQAVAIGFVRLSKVVVGVSLQGGSGILVSRLPDGTWSAPSAMGVYGLGVGLQFGLEVADFLFIIQTNEGLEHFKRGGNFVVGGNIGAAVATCGREAYGAASLGACTGRLPLADQIHTEDEDMNKNDGETDVGSTFDESTYQSGASTLHTNKGSRKNKKDRHEIAPMVAYAMSRGLYFGVSVDGLKFFTRNDINARTYKFAMLSEMPAKDILSGLVAPPPEAEDLYAALHSVEYSHEMTELPRPPEMLRRDSMNDWRFDRSIAASNGDIVDGNDRRSKSNKSSFPPYAFLSTLNREEADEFALFETVFKRYLYGGVSVQHLMPNSAPTRSGMTRRAKRTLWLMLPEVGSLRLGFVSKVKDGMDGDAASVMDDITVESSIASSRADADDHTALAAGNIKLSKKYSVSLTDITTLSQDPNVTIRLSPDDATEHIRVLSIRDVTGKSLLFLADSNREAELLFCGLKLLLECETTRLSVRGGVPLNKLGGKLGKGALSPLIARGTAPSIRGSGRHGDRPEPGRNKRSMSKRKEDLDDRSKYSSFGEPGTSSDESDHEDDNDSPFNDSSAMPKLDDRHQVPEGRQSWSQLPGRSAMRQMASGVASPRAAAPSPPTYELGKVVYTDIATNVSLPLPLSLCRVLFLDSSSPVNRAWENGRADSDYQHDDWAFPPGAVREFEVQSSPSEQQLISRGYMTGAQRTVSYNRTRNRELVRLSESVIVQQDDEQTLEFVIADQMPRRGFSAKARIFLRSFGAQSCEARVVTEIRPVGKNLSNQQAVHKAFVLVLDEMKKRYGLEAKGLLAVFLDVYPTLAGYGDMPPLPARHSASRSPGNSSQPSITSFKDVLTGSPRDSSTAPRQLPGNSSPNARTSSTLPSPSQLSPRRQQQQQRSNQKQERPSTPSLRTIDSKTVGGMPAKASPQPILDKNDGNFADFSSFDDIPRNPVTVEVKPLPKIRLDLCPVPREEDEEEDSSLSVAGAKQKQKRKSKHSKHKHRQRSSRNR